MSEFVAEDVSPDEIPNFIPEPEPAESDGKAEKKRLFGSQRPKPVKSAKVTPRAKQGQFVEPLTEMYSFIGMGLMVVDPVCGQAVVESGEKCAQALDELAYRNPAVRRALMSLTQSSAIGQVVFAHMPIIVAVAAHHGGALFGGGKSDNEPVSDSESA